jgi:hypothetical protein
LAVGITACGSSSSSSGGKGAAVVHELGNNKAVQSDLAGERTVAANCVEKVRDPLTGIHTIEKCLLSNGGASKEDKKCLETWAKNALHRLILHGPPSKKDAISAITGCVKTK